MATGKQKISIAPRPTSPAASTPEAHDKKNKKKKRATTPKTRQDDTDALSPSDTLDFGTLSAPDEGLAEAIAAVLEAPRAAANGGSKCNNLGAAGTDATAAAQAELLATANELYQRMDAGGGGLRPDGAYWAALPAHIRNFVRTASLSPPLHAAGGNEWAKAQAMYAIAQQMVQTGEQGEGQDQTQEAARNEVDASERDMTSAGTVVARWQGEVSLPVDPSFFADATFTATLEEQGEKGGVIGVEVGVAQVRSGEDNEEEERSYLTSEEAVESPVAGERGRKGRYQWGSGKRTAGAFTGVGADEEGRDREEDEEIPTSDRELLTSSELSDSLPKTEASAEVEVAAVSATAAAANAKSSVNNMPSQTRQPSSRAQGKQPMNYAPPPTSTATATTTTTTATTTTTTTTTTTQQKTNTPSPTTRSASKAASKAPLAHPYPHTHPHHHPSPPSSNGSQPQKHRPPSAQVPSSRNPNIKNKIWSTSSTEERERIKEFWLGLGEEERRNLVKVEKEAVLKKMKEQQRHSCACAVCGRKRSVHSLCLCLFSLSSLMSVCPFLRAMSTSGAPSKKNSRYCTMPTTMS